ncbi:MAG TPA: hypothetical protein VEV21_02760 [Burkholderiales bacterium]|nr:hypothetical protein [Burkholderiales bacterium]
MPDLPESIEELDAHISAVRENLRDLVEQASAYSGAADEELVSGRIAEQEAQLDRLTRRRAALAAAAKDA